MIIITAQGRLAHQPELKMGRNMPWTEFRLLDSRYSGGEEHTEAVSFVAFGEDAERFCESTEKGQLISATGTQETSRWKDSAGADRTSVRYVLTWWQGGARPARSRQAAQQEPPGQNGRDAPYQRRAPAAAPAHRPAPPPTPTGERHPNQTDDDARLI